MAKVNNQPPSSSLWPWESPSNLRIRKGELRHLERKTGKLGDPKNPALASTALLDFIGPPSSSEELRLPVPPPPLGHDADLEGFQDWPYLASVAERNQPTQRRMLEQGLAQVNAPPERVERLRALLQREERMLTLVGQLYAEIEEIKRRIREEQADEGY